LSSAQLAFVVRRHFLNRSRKDKGLFKITAFNLAGIVHSHPDIGHQKACNEQLQACTITNERSVISGACYTPLFVQPRLQVVRFSNFERLASRWYAGVNMLHSPVPNRREPGGRLQYSGTRAKFDILIFHIENRKTPNPSIGRSRTSWP
jgi:hypothetical protein